MSIAEHISHPAESAVLIQLGECCSVICQQLLPVCVCVCPCCKGVGCEMIDNSWLMSWHLCVDRWPSGCTGLQWGYGTAVQGALLGSAACQCDVFPYGCLILSVFYWTWVAQTHTYTQENSQCSFWKVWLNSTCGACHFLFLTFGLSLSHVQMLLSQPSYTVSNFCTSEGLSPVCWVERSRSCVAFQTLCSPGGFCSSPVVSINKL